MKGSRSEISGYRYCEVLYRSNQYLLSCREISILDTLEIFGTCLLVAALF